MTAPRTCPECRFPLGACPSCGMPACRCKGVDGLRRHYWRRRVLPPATPLPEHLSGAQRRELARDLRRQGWKHREIAVELGYGYVSSVSHAVRGIKPGER